MLHARRLAPAIFLTLALPFSSSIARAGGGGPPGGGGVGGGGFGNAAIQVDNVTPSGHNYDLNDFYPRSISVHQGDVVTWHWGANVNAIHTVTLVPAGANLSDASINRLIPGGGGPGPDTDDPGRGFALNGLNSGQMRGCGNSPYFPATGACSYTGQSVVNSGVLVPAATDNGQIRKGVPLPTYSVRFNVRPGRYTFFCLVHGPHMSGSVTVLPSGRAVTSPAQAASASSGQYQSQTANAIASESSIHSGAAPGAAGHTNFVVQAGSQSGHVEMNQFYPALASIKAGDAVTFTPGGFHTVSFPPITAGAINPLCEAVGNGPDRPFTGQFAGCNLEVALDRGAIPYGNPKAYSGGALNSGLLVVPQPHAFVVTFTKPGTYRYACLVHRNMFGTVVVK